MHLALHCAAPDGPGAAARHPQPILPCCRPLSRYLSWDDYFMSVAFLSAERSKDPNKQVSA